MNITIITISSLYSFFRQLLALIHLSQARARLDLSPVVSPQHVRDVRTPEGTDRSHPSRTAAASHRTASLQGGREREQIENYYAESVG